MGVHRLWSHIKRHQNAVVTYVDLVDIAKQTQGDLKILVDFYSWENFMVSHFWESMSLSTGNRNLAFAGGEYVMMDSFIREFIVQLKSVNIVLDFFLDGAKGSDYISTKQKLKTWQNRLQDDQNRLRIATDYLRGVLPYEDVDKNRLVRPCLQEVQNITTLQDCECDIHIQVSGEADNVIAEHLQNDPSAFAVLSNDTDFCIFENCVYIAFDFFDIDNDLGLGLRPLSVKKPAKLKCGVIKSEDVIKLLGLSNSRALIEFATISGNDFTLPNLEQVPGFRSYMGQMNKLANVIKRGKVAEQCEFFGQAIATNPDLQEAVMHSRNFYSLNLRDSEETECDIVYKLLAEDIRKGRLPSTVIAMYRGLYWHRVVFEDLSSGLPSAELALAELRAFIYAILLPADKMFVTELGHGPEQAVEKIVVRKFTNIRLPNYINIKMNSISNNLRLFEFIMRHQEPLAAFEDVSYFQMYDLYIGYMCYLLRYFLLMNWGRNLHISSQEFLVLVAWVFGNHDRTYLKLKITPSPRCVTVENWFLVLYRNVYAFLGNILNLSQEFPAPRDLFSGGTWVALYTSCAVLDPNPVTREPAPRSVAKGDLVQIKRRVRSIIKLKENIVRSIIKGLFSIEQFLFCD